MDSNKKLSDFKKLVEHADEDISDRKSKPKYVNPNDLEPLRQSRSTAKSESDSKSIKAPSGKRSGKSSIRRQTESAREFLRRQDSDEKMRPLVSSGKSDKRDKPTSSNTQRPASNETASSAAESDDPKSISRDQRETELAAQFEQLQKQREQLQNRSLDFDRKRVAFEKSHKQTWAEIEDSRAKLDSDREKNVQRELELQKLAADLRKQQAELERVTKRQMAALESKRQSVRTEREHALKTIEKKQNQLKTRRDQIRKAIKKHRQNWEASHADQVTRLADERSQLEAEIQQLEADKAEFRRRRRKLDRTNAKAESDDKPSLPEDSIAKSPRPTKIRTPKRVPKRQTTTRLEPAPGSHDDEAVTKRHENVLDKVQDDVLDNLKEMHRNRSRWFQFKTWLDSTVAKIWNRM